MISYIIRRFLYAIPILIGVNILVFTLFFVVNTPDDMARLHLGNKRVTRDQIDLWKKAHSLDLPKFLNLGWKKIASLQGSQKTNQKIISLSQTGEYKIILEDVNDDKLAQKRNLILQFTNSKNIQIQDNDFSGYQILRKPRQNKIMNKEKNKQLSKIKNIDFNKEYMFDKNAKELEFSFIVKKHPVNENSKLILNFKPSNPAYNNRIIIQYKTPMSFMQMFTQTIFFQRSVQMLFFKFGKSDRGKDIKKEIFQRIGPSLSITLPAFLLSLFLNIFFAMILAFFRGTYIDYWGVITCVILMSISMLFYIIAGQVLFSKILKLFPVSGFDYGFNGIKFILMPVLLSVIAGLGGSIRFYRTIFLEELNKDYVRTARSKGLSEKTVLFLHVLKNAMIPILTGVVVSLPFLFTGSLLLESFFSIPGMGYFLLEAIQTQDFAVVQAMVSLGSFLYIIGLLLTDISYTFVDPRVRLE